jgi:hypothetical protein
MFKKGDKAALRKGSAALLAPVTEGKLRNDAEDSEILVVLRGFRFCVFTRPPMDDRRISTHA